MKRNAKKNSHFLPLSIIFLCLVLVHGFPNFVEANPGPPSLKTVSLPEISGIDNFIKNKDAAIILGKALFWDMQVGSDGIQTCASCHFHAGVDDRTKNQLTPGLLGGDTLFGNNPFTGETDYPEFGPNYTVKPEDFPLHKLADPEDPNSRVIADTNDCLSSQGVFLTQFVDVFPFYSRDLGIPLDDKVFNVCLFKTPCRFEICCKTIRRVEPRNTPIMINAAFNFANFWDGRANNIFNGVNPFGAADQKAKILINDDGELKKVAIRLKNSSLASQAVGPPLSDFEMAFEERNFSMLGLKMLYLRPLAKQMVHPNDSVLGHLSMACIGLCDRVIGLPGLKTSYSTLIKAAFHDKYWNSNENVSFNEEEEEWEVVGSNSYQRYPLTDSRTYSNRIYKNTEFSQIEANFALFFGLAVQAYERTLISDDTPYDQYKDTNSTLTPAQARGLDIFLNDGYCINCHGGPLFTNAAFVDPNDRVEAMIMGDSNFAFYDNSFYNIGVRPTGEDIGRGGLDPFGFPLSFSRLAYVKDCGNPPLGMVGLVPTLKGDFPKFVPNLPHDPIIPDPNNPCSLERVAVDGAFKTPGLRNIELTGPYFHNGGQATLRQVIDFYDRGGDFRKLNRENLDPDIENLGLSENDKNDLVAFLLTLTDKRVKYEKAPFDHPQLFIPNGELGNQNIVFGFRNLKKRKGFSCCDAIREIPAVGKEGRSTPLPTFLDLNPSEQ